MYQTVPRLPEIGPPTDAEQCFRREVTISLRVKRHYKVGLLLNFWYLLADWGVRSHAVKYPTGEAASLQNR